MMESLLLLLVGLTLSAFFSGSETGFYRVTRVRLVIDALKGDLTSKCLLWLINNPAYFVATTLIGNNLANYLTSLAIVLLTRTLMSSDADAVELAATILFSPVVFVYGELLPKFLYYNAPNRLLRLGGPLFLFFSLLFVPVSGLLWLMGLVLQSLVGEAPLRVRLALARHELQEMLQEGQEAGILRPAQRRLAQNLFAVAAKTVGTLCRPVSQVVTIGERATRAEMLHAAQANRATFLVVRSQETGDFVGYLRAVDLHLHPASAERLIRPLASFPESDTHLDALIWFQSEGEEVALVKDKAGKTKGVVYANDLAAAVLQ
jgi:CBS domain containing-hemolysin-like protein